ncbi:MAG TPA: DUF4390 domain-containing protein [Thermoanaerobaculia bacterium]
MRLASLCILSLLLSSAAVAAEEPAIRNLSATAVAGKVTVSFQLTDAFSSEELVAGLQSGVPTSFTYVVEIYRDRPNWFDDGLEESRIEVIATFNSVTREYLLNYRRDRKLVRSESFTDLAALEQRMTVISERGLFDIGRRRPYKLKVRVKADLTRGWRMWIVPYTVSTPWRESRVKVVEGQR